MSSFQVYQDQENGGVAPAAKKATRNENGRALQQKNAVLQPSKRPVLGIIENKVRVQQSRAAKQPAKVGADENTHALKKNETKAAAQSKPIPTVQENKLAVTKLKVSTATAPSVVPKLEEHAALAEPKAEPQAAPKIKCEAAEVPQKDGYSAALFVEQELAASEKDELAYSRELDMSVDSLCGSPMSVDRTIGNRRSEYQNTLEHFYNVEEYDSEIYEYIKNSEMRCRPKHTYMRKQPDITYSMRSILVDWLVEVADEYNLQSETLFLAVSYIDRFLSIMSVVRSKLQLVGTAAMFIASKFEEIYPPDVGEFVYITDDTYTKKQVLRMEHLILKVLNFDMSAPSILRFSLKYCMTSSSPTTVKHLAQYLCEMALLDAEKFLHFLPSEIGSASTALARHTLGLDPWPLPLQRLTNQTLEHLMPCLVPLHENFANAASYPQQAVREKFKASKWSCVALLTPRAGLVPEVPPSSGSSTTETLKDS